MNSKIIVICGLIMVTLLTGCQSQVNSQVEVVPSPTANLEAAGQTEVASVEKIEIVDFHSNRRCFSCQTIEQFAQATLVEFFSEEMQEGKITFQSINVEEAGNEEIVQQYQARGSSLFINVIRNGENNISEETKVWQLVRDEEAYKKYFQEKIANLLN